MDRTERIPDELIEQVMSGLESWIHGLMSVGYPLARDKGQYYFPIYLNLKALTESMPVLAIVSHFND